MELFGWLFKRTEKKITQPPLKPTRLAVHLPNGDIVVHYCVYRLVHTSGRLSLFNNEGGGDAIADYPSGEWSSWSSGKRSVTKPSIPLCKACRQTQRESGVQVTAVATCPGCVAAMADTLADMETGSGRCR